MKAARRIQFATVSSTRWRRYCCCLSILLVSFLSNCNTVHSFTTTTSSSSSTLAKIPRNIISLSSRSHSTQSSTTRRFRHTSTQCYSVKDDYQHTLAILSMPTTSTDKIANEAILNQAVQHTRKLSVVLRCQSRQSPSLAKLRQYVGEVYSTLWDVAMSSGDVDFCDVVVYPQNLPNSAPESWIDNISDLDSVCSHDSICGWISSQAKGRGMLFQSKPGDGTGGLDAHVMAMNADREYRGLQLVKALHVYPWPKGASAEWQTSNGVVFLDDEYEQEQRLNNRKKKAKSTTNGDDTNINGTPSDEISDDDDYDDYDDTPTLIGGVQIPAECLFEKVAVGGTFDGMHYGHRKLLTLAVSSVSPRSGRLMIGVTIDEMLQHKSFNEEIPNIDERIEGVRDFVYRLAPGMKNRITIRAIGDEYGPPGKIDEGSDFDALVLSHETLDNGHKLNEHRKKNLGLKPLALLCTRRTEPHGMSSTALRRRRWERKQRQMSSQMR